MSVLCTISFSTQNPFIAQYNRISIPQTSKFSNSDVFTPIAKYLLNADADKLGAWFSENLELDILGKSNSYSKSQAIQILKDFFKTNKPSKFQISHKSGNSPMLYGVGTLEVLSGKKFSIMILVKSQDGKNEIEFLKILKK
ncbi:MAG: DUF4783 domain-containing protein [Bacteroidales bacterium]